MKKIFFKLCVIVGMVGLVSCSNNKSSFSDEELLLLSDQSNPYYDDSGSFVMEPNVNAKVFNKRLPDFNSLIVCRDKQCAPAEIATSKQYIFNSLVHLIDNNGDDTALLCEANPQTHVCVNPYVTIPAKIGVTPAYVYFDSVKIIDALQVNGKSALELILGYNLSYNGQTPYVCKPDKSMLYVKDNKSVVLNGNGFDCDMTSVGVTKIRSMFNIDYVDLDYGYIGGYYSIGMSGPAYGGGSGYALIRLPKDAHPLSPNLKAGKEYKIITKEPVLKPFTKIDTNKLVKKSAEETLRNYQNTSSPMVNVKENYAISDDEAKATELQLSEGVKSSEAPKKREPLKLEGEDIRPVDDGDEVPTPLYEEIYVEDLDDYIK